MSQRCINMVNALQKGGVNMKTIKYISIAVLFLFPCITSSEEVVLPTETGTQVVLETSHLGGKEITHSRTRIMKQGNRVRMERVIEVEGKERLTGVSIYDGQSTWTISPIATVKSEGHIRYPWNCPQCVGLKSRRGVLEGKEVEIVEKGGVKKYLDAEKGVILLEEKEGEKIYYRDYLLVEGLGYIPKIIEKINSRGDLLEKTVLKGIEELKVFPRSTFEPKEVEVEFPENIKILN